MNKSKKMLVIFLTINKPKNVVYFADVEQVKKMLIILLTLHNTDRPPLVTYNSLCSTCVTYGTLCNAIGHQLLPTLPFTASATDSRERFLLSGVFYLTLLPAFSRILWEPAVQPQVSRASCWSSRHNPGPTICSNHSNPQKFYTSRFYLRARAGQSRNINPYRELVLQNVSFKRLASHGIWNLFTDR